MVTNNFKTILDAEKAAYDTKIQKDTKPLKESKTIFVVSAAHLNYSGNKHYKK